MIQTIPSLALLALLVPVPFLGISATTAIVALFLYGLLPIVRNTATGLQDIPPALRDSAIALGLEPAARLRKIYLPLASRTILAGIKTSAVINIGTATLAALIGAGGLGEPILSGLNLNDQCHDPRKAQSRPRSSRFWSRDCSICSIDSSSLEVYGCRPRTRVQFVSSSLGRGKSARDRIASRIPWSSFLSAGQIVASAPRSITFSASTK